MKPTPRRPLQRLLSLACEVEPREVSATLTSFLLVFTLMAAYYLLRPVRDAMASNWSDAEVSWLWTFTFFFSTAAVSLYGAAVARIRLQHLVPGLYGGFALSFVLFYVAASADTRIPLIDKAFYVWISVFSLFHISVFWSLMADCFSRAQSKRLFGFIGAGASVGAIGGPALVTLLAGDRGTEPLLLIAALMLVLTLPLITVLQRQQNGAPQRSPEQTPAGALAALGGNPFAGFSAFRRNRYLWGIALFIFLYTTISSFVYFELKNLLADYSEGRRAQIWASMDLVVNTLTVLIAAFATGRMANHLGLPFTLASVPVVICAGMLLLAAAPVVAVVVVVQIARRAGNYAISRPAREMLFTAVDRETRFKAKPVIDIVVYRGGDMLNAWAFTALTQGFGLGMAALAVIGAGIAACWGLTGIYLGRHFEREHGQSAASTATSAPNS